MKDDKKVAEEKNPFQKRTGNPGKSNVHVHHGNVICITDSRGFETYRNRGPLEIRVDATDGFIPVWQEGMTLRWRFDERSIRRAFAEPAAAKERIRLLFGEALEKWGDAAPVKFNEADEVTDFELTMAPGDDCDDNGCVLASTFFPDEGRHKFMMYPKLFTQSHKEQVDTFIHESGHIFGLRHFFANIRESRWPSRLFGEDNPFSIMNYGDMSELTDTDREDLKRFYRAVWSGELTEIDGAPIRLFQPYSSLQRRAVSTGRGQERAIAASTYSPLAQVIINGRKVTIE